METALEEVVQTRASRILTSGGRSSAVEGLPVLTRLVQAANGRIAIMPCGGINSANVVQVIQATSANEIHTSLGTSDSSASGNSYTHPDGNGERPANLQPSNFATTFEQNVVDLVSQIDGISRKEPVR
jgi:copper homeostasis protein CutC